MKYWQSFSALKRVKTEYESLTDALANALETVIVTPAGDEKSLDGLTAHVQAFEIIPGLLRLLEYPAIAMLADEILALLQDTLNQASLESEKLDARLQVAFVAVTDLPALIEDGMKESADSFARVSPLINQIRKTWDKAAIFDPRLLAGRQKLSFRKQFASAPDKMKEVLAKQAGLYVKAGKVLLEDPKNEKALHALSGVVRNMEQMFRDYRIGTLWGLAAGVIEAAQGGSGLDDNSVRAVIALAKPLYMISTGDLSHLDRIEDKVLDRMLDVLGSSETKSLRLALIRQWYAMDPKAARQMKAQYRAIQVRFARKAALSKSLQLINEDITALIDSINMLIESNQVSNDKVSEIFQRIAGLREILVFLRMKFLSDHIDQSLPSQTSEDLQAALSQTAGVLFVVNKELVDKLETMALEVFSNEAAITEASSLSSARLHVYQTAMSLLETVITDIDTYVENGCQGSDLKQARRVLDELSRVFTIVSLPEQKQYLATARDYVTLVAHGVDESMPDESFHALSQLVINSLWYLEQLSIGRNEDSQAYLEKSGRFAATLQAFVDSHPAPPDDDPEPESGADLSGAEAVSEADDGEQPVSEPPAAAPPPPVQAEAASAAEMSAVEEPPLTETPPVEAAPVMESLQVSAELDDDDDDIKEIFAEEFDEVLENLQAEMTSLAGDFQQPPAIKDCCRYFHTLKGSGRMVGAEDIGTLSFAMEKLYDYLGEQQGTNEAVMQLSRRVLETLPGMKAHFIHAQTPGPEPALIRQLCEEALGLMSPEAAAEVKIPEVLQSEAAGGGGEVREEAAAAAEPAIPIVTDSVPTLSESVDISGAEFSRATDAVEPADVRGEAVDMGLVALELEEINNALSSILAGDDELPTTSDLQVPLHTLYGISRVQVLENYSDAIKAMENFLEQHPHKTISADMAAVFQGFCLLTSKLARHFARGGEGEYTDLAFEAIDLEKALADLDEALLQPGIPPAADSGEVDTLDPVLAGFIREARDLVARIDNDAGEGELDKVVQSLQLLAGAAEVADMRDVERLAASMEAAYSRLEQADSLTGDELRALLAEARAWLVDMPDQLAAGKDMPGSGSLCEQLLAALAPAPAAAEAPETIEAAEPVAVEAPEMTEEIAALVDPAASAPAVPEPPAAEPEEPVDQELMAIFLDEADEILEALDDLYLRWQDGDESVIDEYLRHLHTLKGSSALVREMALSKGAHEFETFIIDARNARQGYDANFFAACDIKLQGLLEIYRLYGRDASGRIVRQPGASAPAVEEVLQSTPHAEAHEEPEAVPEPVMAMPEPEPELEREPEPETETAPAPQAAAPDQEEPVDQTLMAIFLDEAEEILEEIDGLYLRWQEGDESVIDEYLRHLHTLKGSSALVREMALSKGAHEFETFIIDARNAKQGYDAEFFIECDKRMQGLQEIYRLYSRDDKGMIVRAAGQAPPAPAPISAPEVAAPKVESSVVATPKQEPQPFQAPPPPVAVGNAAKQAVQNIQAAVDEQVRVSSQLLKNLMNDADEINFSRNRIERSFHDIGTLLVDMDETLHRLRAYVKRFEDKARESYNTHIQDNPVAETGRISDEFDALEMDRYTELHEMSLSLNEDYDDLQDIRLNLAGRLKEIDNVLMGQQRLTNSLQDGLISSQMVPFSSIVPRLRRLVRQISRELNKDVRFEVENQQGNLDKNVLQAIITPFEHLIRNALDHGIEAPDQRRKLGKPEQAILSIRVTRMGASIIIEIRDDGRGINVDKVKSRAIERGILDKDADISNEAACMLVFKPGFSTADAVSNISGRGVGLDVVRSEITQIGGSVEIQSQQGKGTAFIIQLPLTTSLNRSLMFEVLGQRFVVLMNTLDGVKVEKLANILARQQGGEAVTFDYGGKTYEYAYLGKLLNLDKTPRLESVDTSVPMLLVSGKDKNFALHIDRITESRDLVVKAFSKQFAAMPGIGGGVIMPDGNVAVVLDLVSLVNQATEENHEGALDLADAAERQDGEKRRSVVMVVDDSITVRKVTTSTLRRHGLDVITAKNGLEAIEQLETQVPDVILLDIEMPKMDGFEVATHIRKQEPPVGTIPIIMITSRIGDKHRTRAQEIGVNEFMSKPFVEDVLIAHIRNYQKK